MNRILIFMIIGLITFNIQAQAQNTLPEVEAIDYKKPLIEVDSSASGGIIMHCIPYELLPTLDLFVKKTPIVRVVRKVNYGFYFCGGLGNKYYNIKNLQCYFEGVIIELTGTPAQHQNDEDYFSKNSTLSRQSDR